MNQQAEPIEAVAVAPLRRDGMLQITGDDARGFLHGQLTNDVEHLASDRARLAGWCTPKGRLLATLLVVPAERGFFLLLARDLVPSVVKRLRMFVLRAKVTIEDASDQWAQFGLFGAATLPALAALGVEIPDAPDAVVRTGDAVVVRVGGDRARMLVPAPGPGALVERLGAIEVDDSRWQLEDIRMGLPQVVAATQDLFVPQMLNLEAIAAVDFKKGCYPGQEVVARAQFRGQVKRRMVRARMPAGATLMPGQDLFSDDQPGQPSGTVVAAAPGNGGSEILAVIPTAAAEHQVPMRAAPDGPALELLPLPYAV
jgi:folate-binding protein YgfZ